MKPTIAHIITGLNTGGVDHAERLSRQAHLGSTDRHLPHRLEPLPKGFARAWHSGLQHWYVAQYSESDRHRRGSSFESGTRRRCPNSGSITPIRSEVSPRNRWLACSLLGHPSRITSGSETNKTERNLDRVGGSCCFPVCGFRVLASSAAPNNAGGSHLKFGFPSKSLLEIPNDSSTSIHSNGTRNSNSDSTELGDR